MPYLPNLSGPDGELNEKSVHSFTNELVRTSKLGIEYLVMDLGSDRGRGKDDSINQLLKTVIRELITLNPHTRKN